MRRWRGLNLITAYPGTLGDGLPEPPFGYWFVLDDLERYVTDDFGNFIVVEWNDG